MVLLGNYQFEQGNYQEAIALYFDSLKLDVQKDVILFNLGVAYNALGETEPAISMWDKSSTGSSEYFKALSYYNKGVVLYQLNKYEEATYYFKKALLFIPNSIDIKINLELSLSKFKEQESQTDTEDEKKPLNKKNADNSQQERILDYLRRRDVLFWSSGKEGVEWKQQHDDW